MEQAVSENLIAGGAMSRRTNFQNGTRLEPGPAGQGGAGIGTGIPRGSMSLIQPTHSITETGETLVIDGIAIEFQLTPGTEAPAEMNFYIPHLRALCLAENANATMHNVLPPRGALVRDAKAWADYLTESIALYADKTDVMFVSHGWPRWGQAEITEYMAHHRDAYKYLHDQTIRLMNKGYVASEIAEVIALPESLASKWYNRGYYGTMSHNSKAVYQRYLGWYDGNPANLNPWPPEEAGKRYVAAMGGAKKALKVAQKAYDGGDYRWAAEVASHIVFADDTNMKARELLAKAFEQMGYQAEGSLWRNMYLTGAAEAREAPTDRQITTVSPDMIGAITTPQVFDMLAIRVDPAKAEGIATSVAFVFPDRGETRRVSIRNSVLIHEEGAAGPVDATVTIPRPAFLAMLFAGQTAAALMEAGIMKVEGEPGATAALMSVFDPSDTGPPFEVVTPYTQRPGDEPGLFRFCCRAGTLFLGATAVEGGHLVIVLAHARLQSQFMPGEQFLGFIISGFCGVSLGSMACGCAPVNFDIFPGFARGLDGGRGFVPLRRHFGNLCLLRRQCCGHCLARLHVRCAIGLGSRDGAGEQKRRQKQGAEKGHRRLLTYGGHYRRRR
jgi:alkyl sulfatase BDS1-like metallo-beta-lactamase superfamily hydrolase